VNAATNIRWKFLEKYDGKFLEKYGGHNGSLPGS